jgi:CBS domain-containing protein
MNTDTLRIPIHHVNPVTFVCVKYDSYLIDVLTAMKDNRSGCAIVVKNEILFGIFTERDVVTKVIQDELDLSTTTVSEVMTRSPEYLFDDDEIAYALNRMHLGGFRHIPLLGRGNKPVGVISVRDILTFIHDALLQKQRTRAEKEAVA